MVAPGEGGYLAEYGINVHRVTNSDSAAEFMRWLGNRRNVLGVDTETQGLRPDFHKIRYIQFGDLKTGWAIPWEGPRSWAGLAIEALEKYEGDFVLHNSKFDVRNIEKWSDIKWPWHRTHDTMAMAHLVDPLRLKGLKPLAARLIDPQAIAAQKILDDAMHDNKWTWETIPMDYQWFWVYAAMDPILTCHIYEHLAPAVQSSYMEPYDLEMGTTRVISKMEAKGIRVDLDYSRRKTTELTEYAQKARQWITDTFKIQNPNSNDQLRNFFVSNDIPMLEKSTDAAKKRGEFKQAMDKDVLKSIDHPVAETVLNFRKAEKLVGPYFKNFIELADDEDRIHANVWTMGTRTARMSVTDPGLQTLPKRDVTVRTAFIPSDDYGIISCDYSQIESRLMAHFSQSPGLVNAFKQPEDFFLTIASMIFQERITDKKDRRRDVTKNTVYGKMYGAGPETMAKTAGVHVSQMEDVVSKFDQSFPEVRQMMTQIETVGKQRYINEGMAYIITPTGRRLAADDGKVYTLVNYLIQSHAAEIFKRAIVNLDTVLDAEYGDDVALLLPVHDEIVAEAPLEIAEEVTQVIADTMADHDNYSVPIIAEGEWAKTNWGDLVS